METQRIPFGVVSLDGSAHFEGPTCCEHYRLRHILRWNKIKHHCSAVFGDTQRYGVGAASIYPNLQHKSNWITWHLGWAGQYLKCILTQQKL